MKHSLLAGLESHVQLNTVTKMFCGCPTAFGAEPNTHVCPVCTGMPGVLPVINVAAFEKAVLTAMALDCEIADVTRFDRKSYYYPDLPKNYQISQYDEPLSLAGHLDYNVAGRLQRVRITRVHLEEDAGKLIHSEKGETLVDLNRAGVPLMEIVSEPDLHSGDEAFEYLTALKLLLLYLGVSNCNMEEGNIRCDLNVNLLIETDDGRHVATPICELKNLNSFSAVRRATDYEYDRQLREFESSGHTRDDSPNETRGWDDQRGITVPQRQKEEAQDYRYFPEPDLPPILISQEWKDRIRRRLPELPATRSKRFMTQYELPEYDAGVLVQDSRIADFFEKAVAACGKAKQTSNWVMGEVMRHLNEHKARIDELGVSPDALGKLVNLVADGQVSAQNAREVFAEMAATAFPPEKIIKMKGLAQLSDSDEIEKAVEEVLARNAKAVADFRAGRKQAMGFLIGMVMRATKGKADPGVVTAILQEKLSGESQG